LDNINRSCRLGIVIGEKTHWDRGFGAEALHLLLEYAFNILNMNNVNLGTYSFNKRAIACYKKVGFKEIGRRRESRIIGEKKYDTIMMDILAREHETVYLADVLPVE
jgi:RimJ/RimL family protein N-acetyltransferase